jgi:hypothetical protein
MKTQKRISEKIPVTITTIIVILILAACSGHQTNKQTVVAPTSAAEKKTKPPAMDIHTAALMGDTKAIRQHIDAGTGLDQKDQYGSTPLVVAITFDRAEVARILVKAGADVNGRNNDGSTPLHTAAFLCRLEIVQLLLEHGADKTIRNNFGSTPYESVAGPFSDVKPIYDQFSKDLGPFGFKLDYDHVQETRPKIAEMLQ